MSDENTEGLIPFPLNWIFAIIVCVGLFALLFYGLGVDQDVASLTKDFWHNNYWNITLNGVH